MSVLGRGRIWLRRVLLGALLAGSLAVVFGVAAWFTLRASVRFVAELTVPSVIGSDQEEAAARLRELGLHPQVSGRRADSVRPEGKVLDQFPAAGSRSKPGRPVRLVVSSGPENTAVPDLVGSSVGRAQLALRRAGLADLRPGAVVAEQRPPVGSRITTTTRITLTPAPSSGGPAPSEAAP